MGQNKAQGSTSACRVHKRQAQRARGCGMYMSFPDPERRVPIIVDTRFIFWALPMQFTQSLEEARRSSNHALCTTQPNFAMYRCRMACLTHKKGTHRQRLGSRGRRLTAELRNTKCLPREMHICVPLRKVPQSAGCTRVSKVCSRSLCRDNAITNESILSAVFEREQSCTKSVWL